MNALAHALRRDYRVWIAGAVLVALFTAYIGTHPRGLSMYVLTIWANQGTTLSLVAVGQTFAVLTGGLDLSIGSIMALSNALSSELVNGAPWQIALGLAAVAGVGLACGFVNGCVVVFGRIQPIVATLATGAVFGGLALAVRPIPGGEVSMGLSDALTYDVLGLAPASLVLLVGLVLLVWLPVRNSLVGRGIYAVGSSEGAAFMSGLDTRRAKLVAYSLGGLFGALAGIFHGLVTLSGDATIGFTYTLNSIAAVVIGGTLLTGGTGGVVGSIIGAFILRTIGALMFFAGAPPLAQPLFEGLILVIAVGIGSLQLLRIQNRLQTMP